VDDCIFWRMYILEDVYFGGCIVYFGGCTFWWSFQNQIVFQILSNLCYFVDNKDCIYILENLENQIKSFLKFKPFVDCLLWIAFWRGFIFEDLFCGSSHSLYSRLQLQKHISCKIEYKPHMYV